MSTHQIDHPVKIENVVIEPSKYCNMETEVYVTQYCHDNSLAVFGRVLNTDMPAYKASICLPDTPPQQGCFWFKTWAENQDLLPRFIEAGIVKPTGRTMAIGNDSLAIEVDLILK